MDIEYVLRNKKRELINCGNPLQVQFTLDEINVLANADELRKLKLKLKFPAGFERSSDLFACTKKIIDGDSDYRTLEFCVLKNNVLRMPVSKVFQRLGWDK